MLSSIAARSKRFFLLGSRMGNMCSPAGGCGDMSGQSSLPHSTHIVSVKTGDKKGAGTDGNVFLSMADIEGNWSKESVMDAKFRNDFEQGKLDVFHLDCPGLGKVQEICIRRDHTQANDLWYLEKIEVENRAAESKTIFPVLRWIHANDKLKLEEFDLSLPMFDKNPEQRAAELERKREEYKLVENIPGGPKQIAKLPGDERFSTDYRWNIQAMKMKLFAQTTFIKLSTPKFQKLSDFDGVYKGDLNVPYGQESWKSDEEFGNQRLSGCNPTMIELCKELPNHFAVTAEMIEPFLEGKTMKDALDSKKLYLLDLTYMAQIQCAADRKLCGPYGLFYSNNQGNLVPIAIQLMPKPADDNPVFLPSDPEYTWLAAKMWFNLSDCSHHQSFTHLGSTHLVMECVSICTHRQLSPSHPIFKLLGPHFLYLIAINTLAVSKLVSPDGWVDETMQIGRTGMFNIIAHNWNKWSVSDNGNIINDIKRRGVDDVEALPNYHYRDDAMLLWGAISRYAGLIIDVYYDTKEKLLADHEIQAWVQELTSADVKGVPKTITTNEELRDLVTTFIFIASVSHAAANFCQYDEYAYPPNYPAKLIGTWPKSKKPLTENYIVGCLPDKKQTLSVMIVTKILSARGTNEISNFEVTYAHDPLSLQALKRFKEDLAEVADTIDERNAKRERKYTYLHPKEVPNAISI